VSFDVGIISVDHDPEGRTVQLPDGREFVEQEVLLTEDANKRVRLGYQCGRCFECFVTAWPDECRLCGFPVATIQREYYEREFRGERVLRTSLTSAELADGERRLYEALQRRG
jgi:hypothetical protein